MKLMQLMSCLRGGCVLATLVAQVALAGAISDVNDGQGLFLNNVTVTLDGHPYTALGYTIPKTPGTLDLDLKLSDFGIRDSQNIHATARVNNDIITWTFDKKFDPPVSIDGTNQLEHAYGQFVVKARFPSGFEQTLCLKDRCSRNARLSLAEGSQLTLEGSSTLGFSWSRVLGIQHLAALGGVPRPDLASLGVPDEVYASRVPQTITLGVSLTSAAPSGGAKVDFSSSAPAYLQIQPNLIIPQGRSLGTVTAKVLPNFEGDITVRAASNASIEERIVHILPASKSDGEKQPWDKTLYLSDLLAGCTMCTQYIDFTEEGMGLALLEGRPAYFTPKEAVDLGKLFEVSSISAVDLARTGWLTGTLVTDTRETQAFKANIAGVPEKPTLIGDFTPVAINAYGVVLGNRKTETGTAAGVQSGTGKFVDLDLAATSSEAKAMSELGHIVGVMVRDGRTLGFSYYNGRAEKLPTLSESSITVPAAVNQFGVIAGSSQNSDGVPAAVRVDASGNVSRLGELSGYSRSWATSINDLGWIVGTASDGKNSVGFLWTPTGGLVDLNRLADPKEGLVVTEALKVTNNKQIVIKGQVDGKEDLYVLGL